MKKKTFELGKYLLITMSCIQFGDDNILMVPKYSRRTLQRLYASCKIIDDFANPDLTQTKLYASLTTLENGESLLAVHHDKKSLEDIRTKIILRTLKIQGHCH